ncbi:MalY/PatB family protein [Wukongibacter sp. M2B1]|uniref:MalY/PatB family protein n=1 Tax=Wukongibacter sp. M2B1 TaxID=3088895 RepID=UPI003D7B7903
MKYDFDSILDRKKDFSAKWCEVEDKFGDKDIFPMWIADMDFKTAPVIMKAMEDRLKLGTFGYTTRPESYNRSIVNWMKERHGWEVKKDWLIFSPGVMPTISLLIQKLTSEGDKIIIQQPVYSPFSSVVTNNKRELVVNPLKKDENGKWVMDFDDLERKIDDKTKMLILCNPHNPIGRVWTKEELTKLGDICLKNNIKVISDEIHSDIVYEGHRHIPFSSISEEFAQNSITCLAPSKTFNIPGLQASVAVLPNKSDYDLLDEAFTTIDIKRNNCFSLVACEAAYTKGQGWLEALKQYLESNIDYVIEYIDEHMPKIKVMKPEGTYLMWLDFNELNLTNEELFKLMKEKGKIALNNGESFGIGGNKHMRLNIACPRSMVEEGLKRIRSAVESI